MDEKIVNCFIRINGNYMKDFINENVVIIGSVLSIFDENIQELRIRVTDGKDIIVLIPPFLRLKSTPCVVQVQGIVKDSLHMEASNIINIPGEFDFNLYDSTIEIILIKYHFLFFNNQKIKNKP